VNERAGQDVDTMPWTAYMADTTRTGRRLVNMPITDYNTGIALGYGMFLLL
jgi:hypothetical protein